MRVEKRVLTSIGHVDGSTAASRGLRLVRLVERGGAMGMMAIHKGLRTGQVASEDMLRVVGDLCGEGNSVGCDGRHL